MYTIGSRFDNKPRQLKQHSCDACGAVRIPSNDSCEVCGIGYTQWVYLTHSQALELLITLDTFNVNSYTMIIREYPNNCATVDAYDEANGGGYIGSL